MSGVFDVGGYHFLPCVVLPSKTQRNIYYKTHKGKATRDTIFATNFPPCCPLSEIIQLFSQFGSITSINHGIINNQATGKVKTQQSTKQLTKLDLNMNINIGRSYKEDYDLKYKKINDINAIEARKAEIRRTIREKKRSRNLLEELETSDMHDRTEEQQNETGEEETTGKPDPITFLGCEYIHITYRDIESVEHLMSLTEESLEEAQLFIDLNSDDSDESDDENEHSGSAFTRWINEYNEQIEDLNALESQSNAFMSRFDDKRRREAEEKAKQATMDEEGWVTVTASKRKKANDGTIKVTGVKAESVILRRGKKSKILSNFYKFQKNEERREKLIELRKQFEEDKMRIEQMKANKQFRPFKGPQTNL